MIRVGLSSLSLCFSLLVLFSCTDNTIEGASVTGFKVNKVTAANTTINTGSCIIVVGKPGTNFVVTLEFQGTEQITAVSVNYKFTPTTATGTSPTPASGGPVASPTYTIVAPTATSGTFRSSGAPGTVKVSSCLVFGTSTSITYDYVITTGTTTKKTYPASIIINKPAGAN